MDYQIVTSPMTSRDQVAVRQYGRLS